MAEIRTLTTVFKAQTAKFIQKIKGARGALKRFSKSIFTVKNAMGALAGGFVANEMRKVAQEMDRTAKFADRLGIATEALVGLQHAAKLTGVQTRAMEMGMQRMTRRVAEAATGLGEARVAIKELGLDARRLAQLPPEEQFIKIADAMQKVEGESHRVRVAFKLFDSEGVALKNTLARGGTEIRRMVDEARLLGLTFSRAEARKVEEMNDAWERVTGTFNGIARGIVVDLAPAFLELASAMLEVVRAGQLISSGYQGIGAVIEFIARGRSAAPMDTGDLKRKFVELENSYEGTKQRIKLIRERIKQGRARMAIPAGTNLTDREIEMRAIGDMRKVTSDFKMTTLDPLLRGYGDEAENFIKLIMDSEKLLVKTKDSGQDFAIAITAGFNEAIFAARTFTDALRGVAQQIASIALNKAIFAPIGNMLGGALQGGLDTILGNSQNVVNAGVLSSTQIQGIIAGDRSVIDPILQGTR